MNVNNNQDFASIVDKLKKNKDAFVREDLAKFLRYINNEHSLEVLKELVADRNYLVQIEAIESLYAFPYEKAMQYWIKYIQDIHWSAVMSMNTFVICVLTEKKLKEFS